jgi:hypothetical protein
MISVVEVMNEWSLTYTHPFVFMARCVIKYENNRSCWMEDGVGRSATKEMKGSVRLTRRAEQIERPKPCR